MKFESKYGIEQEVYFLNFPFAQEKTYSTIRVEKGKICDISFNNKSVRYSINTSDVHYSEIKEKHIFKRKKSAKKYLLNKYVCK